MITSIDFNITFAFSSFTFYTHFRIIPLSHFIHVHFCAFALLHFITFPEWTTELRFGQRASPLGNRRG